MRVILSLLCLAACNTASSPAVDMDPPPPDLSELPPDLSRLGTDEYPAPHDAPPQAATENGPVLPSLVIVPVFFGNDDDTERMAIQTFEAAVGSSNYWLTGGAEYGIGAATSATPVVLTETKTGVIDDQDIRTWLAGELNTGTDLPAPVAGAVYVIHYPPNVGVTLNSSSSCTEFGGYHGSITLDAAHSGQSVAYAVIPRCPTDRGLSTINTASATISHELFEAASDPYPDQMPTGYSQVDGAHFYWQVILGGGEIGDLCAQEATSFTQFPGLDFTVQRIWSNRSALAGHDPCIPIPAGEIYFNSVPKLEDSISIFGTALVGVNIPVGTSKTIDLDLYSDADTGPWNVSVSDYNHATKGTAAALSFTLDKKTGRNGEVLKLTITSLTAGQFGSSLFIVDSKLGSVTHRYYGLVGQQ